MFLCQTKVVTGGDRMHSSPHAVNVGALKKALLPFQVYHPQGVNRLALRLVVLLLGAFRLSAHHVQ